MTEKNIGLPIMQAPRPWTLKVNSCPQSDINLNIALIKESSLRANPGQAVLLLVKRQYVVTARVVAEGDDHCIYLNKIQRDWIRLARDGDTVDVETYQPGYSANHANLAYIDVQLDALSKESKASPELLKQDRLEADFKQKFRSQILAPGQIILYNRGERLNYAAVIKKVGLKGGMQDGSLSEDSRARGFLTSETTINWIKAAGSEINLERSTKLAPANAVIRPDFKFEDLGIGGLDREFSDIFRRAFASRIFPPGLADKLGIQHVRGILLYGPPGTGKTLIARQIGKMLNAKEPKVINGPEVLNKYVGQSEENIRKLFADAEKEQKEKGNDSDLHIIIFDELDAVCKQRGSGAGGGTGVGDSVVNQLLSKLDGVEQLNNILLIGMTNRKDMIDEALLRSGRLEVHMEISLPDEPGRRQILKIHTTKMRDNDKLAPDVDITELARLTRNFSGAELSGLVKSASSFALQRHIKGGTVAALKDDVEQMRLRQQDFLGALEEVKPLFGVSEEELERCVDGGIIHYGPHIDKILADGRSYVNQVRTGSTDLFSLLLYGPRGSGKTALAARIALDSEFPFIKMVRPYDMIGMNEIQKIQTLQKVFTDAYKSPLNVLVLDNIELLIDWVPIGPRFSSAVLAALKSLMEQRPSKSRPLLIIGTTSNRSVLQQLEVYFKAEIAVPYIRTPNELAHLMLASKEFDEAGVQRALSIIRENTGSQEIRVGVQQALLGIQTAMQDPSDRAGRFAEVISGKIASLAES